MTWGYEGLNVIFRAKEVLMLYYITYKNVNGRIVIRPFTENLDVVLWQLRRKDNVVISVQHV